jgi:hypothetical protein
VKLKLSSCIKIVFDIPPYKASCEQILHFKLGNAHVLTMFILPVQTFPSRAIDPYAKRLNAINRQIKILK